MSSNLGNTDIELLIDQSASMNNHHKGGKSRWQYVQETTQGIAVEADKVDADGIVVTTFNNKFKTYEGVNAAKVDQIFTENSPMGGTDTAAALKSRLDAWRSRKAAGTAKPLCIIVVTDGEPNDKDAVAAVIVDATKDMTADEDLAIQFVQVGDDPSATKFLADLDDGLQAKGAKYDCVDTTQIDEITSFVDLVEKSFAD